MAAIINLALLHLCAMIRARAAVEEVVVNEDHGAHGIDDAGAGHKTLMPKLRPLCLTLVCIADDMQTRGSNGCPHAVLRTQTQIMSASSESLAAGPLTFVLAHLRGRAYSEIIITADIPSPWKN